MDRVTGGMVIGEVVKRHPKVAFVMQQYGFHCVGCHVSQYETIEQGARTHGMSDEELLEMLEDVNLFIEEEERHGAG